MKIRTTAPEKGNKYYTKTNFGGYNKCILGNPNLRPWQGSVLSNCVGYAYGRFMEMAGKHTCELPTCNAEDWYAAASKYKRGQEPKVGAVIVWAKGKLHSGNDGCGHVAVVERINKDGSLFLSESDYSTDVFKNRTVKKHLGKYYLGSKFKFLGFIYNPDVKDESVKKYTVGNYEVTTDVLHVRKGPGTKYDIKKFSKLSKNAQARIKDLAGKPVDGYVKGLKFTATEIKNNWGKTPSGWVCLDYCKKI